MFENNNNSTNQTINKEMYITTSVVDEIYDNLTFFDLYGSSVIIFIIITLFIFIVFSYCKIMQTKQPIVDDWANQRCKPQNMLLAGFINHPEGKTAFEYTSENFQYCIQGILKNITGYALEPFQYMIQSITQIFNEMNESIQNIRKVIARLRNGLSDIAQDLMNRLLNIMIPIQKIFISLIDVFQKTQGTMTAGLYTMLGSYFTLQTIMGSIMELIIKILVALSIIIVGLWITPFTWPAAASMSSVFVAISIPLGIIAAFMKDVLHINSSGIPKLRCFDEYTPITLLGGKKKYIKYINVGDMLMNGSYVTSKIKTTSEGLNMYKLNNVIVSETHLVKYNHSWIRVSEHPEAKYISYNQPYLYCLNTSNKNIIINDIIFSDWDEINYSNFYKINKKNKDVIFLGNIHEYLDDGFEENTKILLQEETKNIQDIKIGDLLYKGSKVYGIVEVECKKLKNNKNNNKKCLYHLLTTNGLLNINGIEVGDYNTLIDKNII